MEPYNKTEKLLSKQIMQMEDCPYNQNYSKYKQGEV